MNTLRDVTNYYEILEVTQDASQSDIHRAYQRAKSTYSQDNPALYSMFSREEARELLRMIEEAYSILGNGVLRKTYDDSRAGGAFTRPESFGRKDSAPLSSASPSASMARSAHAALPDFSAPNDLNIAFNQTIQEDSMISMGGFMVRRKEATKSSLPPGTGRTSLSTYKLDENFETEVGGCEDFNGALIQKIRLYKNISVDKMSEATRISRTYLMAVETGDFKALPAAVFVRGFVVQIARVLGLDENKVAASYMKHFKAGGGK
jgi:curved DNA-binding protein CbpA